MNYPTTLQNGRTVVQLPQGVILPTIPVASARQIGLTLMKNVNVIYYNGVTDTNPQEFVVEQVLIYQDIITSIIRNQLKSGQIYDMQGYEVNYDSLIILPKVQYIAYAGDANGQVTVRDYRNEDKEKNYTIPLGNLMKNRDLYNYMVVVKDGNRGFMLVSNGVPLDLNQAVNPRMGVIDLV